MTYVKDIKDQLTAISLLDGRNWDKVKSVAEYFSEFALMRYRIRIEVSYLQFLSSIGIVRSLTNGEKKLLDKLWKQFDLNDGHTVKEFEKKTNHDVKAIEYYIQQKCKNGSLTDLIPFIHIGLTSYDINIPAYALMISDFRKDVYLPSLSNVLVRLKTLIVETQTMVMLGRTHGQPALPTTLGKELAVYYQRLKKEKENLARIQIEAKLTGAVGNFNALYFIDPKYDWLKFSSEFISSLKLTPNLITTQILPYDSWINLFDALRRINNILLGFSQDIWWYISFEYFLQKKKEAEVGSSTMSHKINPITFENAEGNLGIANSLFEFFSRKLSYSRLQRDLSDSTVKRDFGLAFGFSLLAYDSLLSGLKRIKPNPSKMKEDLDKHWEIFSEGIQTYLRMKGLKNAYELLKEKTRGRTLSKEQLYKIIDSLPLEKSDKEKLKIKDLSNYSGLARELAEIAIQE